MSLATMMWQEENGGSDLLNQLRNKAKKFESIPLQLDESNDTSDTIQLLITIIWDTTESSNVVQKPPESWLSSGL